MENRRDIRCNRIPRSARLLDGQRGIHRNLNRNSSGNRRILHGSCACRSNHDWRDGFFTGKLPDAVLLIWVFFVMSFVGLVGESVVSLIQDGFWKDRAGLLWGPFSPVYGLGAAMMTLLASPLRNASAWAVFAAAGVAGAAFEWLTSWFLEKGFGIVAWSYSTHLLNVGGRTSLLMAIIWGALGVVWVRVGLPLFTRALGRLPQRVQAGGAALICVFFLANAAATLMAFNCWFERLAGELPHTPIQQFFAQHYDDEFMARRFQTMSLWAELANR